MKESDVSRLIQLELSKIGARLFRNNSGALQNKHGNWVHYGVASPGGSDLIGWAPVIITEDMIGQHVAVFFAVEIKSENGIASKEQKQFIKVVKEAGGIAGIARSPDEALSLLEGKHLGRAHIIRAKPRL